MPVLQLSLDTHLLCPTTSYHFEVCSWVDWAIEAPLFSLVCLLMGIGLGLTMLVGSHGLRHAALSNVVLLGYKLMHEALLCVGALVLHMWDGTVHL